MTFAIAANVKKATDKDAYGPCICRHKIPKPLIDQTITELSAEHNISQISRALEMTIPAVKNRGKKLGLTFLTKKECGEPSKGEWIHHGTVQGYLAGVPPRLLLGGSKAGRVAMARWKAFGAILDSNPRFSIAGVARVSGFHHATVLHGLKKIGYWRTPPA